VVPASTTTTSTSSTVAAADASPTPAGVDQVFGDDGGLDLPLVGGIRRKYAWS
jgi:hypothetical protein